MSREFDLIARYFSRPAPAGTLGVGDDCALVPIAPGYQLATSTDLLIQGRHFFPDVDPAALGHKALAVNISDLAAMGATPLACLLSLSLPSVNERWLADFSNGFYQFAQRCGCALVGGDTTQGDSIVINVTVLGQVKPHQALRRSAARPEDHIWITGYLGAADVALELLQPGALVGDTTALLATLRGALETPEPPWQLGMALAGVARAAIDISDGLLQDLGHILHASQCGATLDYNALPCHPAIATLPPQRQERAVLCGGDVYQLCFTADPDQAPVIERLATALGVKVSRIGKIDEALGLRLRRAGNDMLVPVRRGYSHFA